MKIIVIGAVAAGTSAATKARRNAKDAQITVYEKDRYISYSACGIPYYLGGHSISMRDLAPRDPSYFKNKYDVDILTGHEVLDIDPARKVVSVKELDGGETFEDPYDILIIASGAKAVAPPIKGIEKNHVFTLRNINDMNRVKAFMEGKKPKNAAIVGTGFIGLELCENFAEIGMKVSLIERLPQVTPGLDEDMAEHVQERLEKNGVDVIINDGVAAIHERHVATASGKEIPGDIVIVAAGVKAEVEMAKRAGVEIGVTGAIKVNSRMETSIPGIYACGDCIEHYHFITKKPVWKPLGSTANKTGRLAGDIATGQEGEFRGVIGTSIFSIFGLAVAQTGLSQREAVELGYNVAVVNDIKMSKAEYMGGKEIFIKAIADKDSGLLLGAQVIGEDGVDKRIDVYATAIALKAQAKDLAHFDLAYSPMFSTVRDPVNYTGMIMEGLF